MIKFETFKLDNGMEVIHNKDEMTSLAVVNLLYKVGSRNEDPTQTGLAHLFEHLMFSGSKNAPDFDQPLQEAGGENNAFTNTDITNYYNTLPADNIDTALWLEADRMADLSLTQENLSIQKKVVIEEFQETCLNKPYGDSWHHVCDMSYANYPYRWPTIGYDPSHVESVTLDNALKFYGDYYQPGNAVLSIASPYDHGHIKKKVNHWFGDIQGKKVNVDLPNEIQLEEHFISKQVFGKVSAQHLFLVFPMPDRLHPDYYQYDLLSDILGYGKSSRLITRIVKPKSLFTSLSAYITGTMGPGLFIVEGRLQDGVSIDSARAALWTELNLLCDQAIENVELQKVKNKAISSMKFGDVSLLNRAMNLAYYGSLGKTEMMNQEDGNYEAVTSQQLSIVANRLFRENPHRELIYSPQP